jgi:hypothetical protein
MAIEKTVKINVDTNSAVNAMDSLSKATHDVSQSFEEVYGDLQPLTTRMGEAEDRLYELANAGKTTTKEYRDLLKTVGNYRKVQINTDLAVDSAASTMSQRLGGALSGVTSGFSVVTGVMGTFGAESEEVEKLLLRVNAAMAMAQGLQGLKDAKPAIIDLGRTIGKIPGVQKLVTLGQKAWNAAMSANPIGLIVAGIVALIATGAALFAWFKSAEAATAKHTAAVNANEKAMKKQTIALKNKATEADRAATQELAMAKASGMSAKAIRTLELKLIDEKIARERSTKATLLDTYETNKNSLAKLRAADSDEDIINRQLKLTAESGKNILTQNENIKAALNQKKDIQNRHLVEIKTAEVQANNEAKERAKEASDNARSKQKERAKEERETQKEINAQKEKAAEEANKFKKEAETEFLNQIEAIQEENWQNTLTQQEREEQAVAAKYFTIEQLAIGNAEQLAIIEMAKNAELKVITDKAAADKLVADEKKADADKEIADKEIATAKAVAEQKAAIQSQGIDTALQGVQLIKGLFEKQKGVQKAAVIAESAIGIAKMIIANKLANVAALATPQAVLTSGASAVPVIAMNNISTGIGIAANIAATGKALQSLGGGSPPPDPNIGGGGGGSAGGQQQAPSFNVVGNSGINQLAQIQQQPTQAYVVSGAVTSAQSLDRNRVQNATIG